MLVSGVTIVFHMLVPAMLLLWQWLGVDRSRAAWSLKTLATGSYLVLLLLAGVWVALPWYLGYLYFGLWATVGVWQYRRLGADHSRSSRRFRAIISGAAAALFIAGSIHAWMGHRPFDKEHVDLAFPLRGGTYYVISGGSNALMNLHFKTLTDQRFHRYRGQSYAVDIVKLNRYGIRSSSPWPRELADYEIFGDAVYAPCAGTVVRTEDSVPDLVPPGRDRVNLAGNFVAIDCKGVRVLLAHLKQGSLLIKTGEAVTEGHKLGQIGNSGNTDEPHLHIHAERPTDPAKLLDTEPVPIRFDGRFCARNDRVRAYLRRVSPGLEPATMSILSAGDAGHLPVRCAGMVGSAFSHSGRIGRNALVRIRQGLAAFAGRVRGDVRRKGLNPSPFIRYHVAQTGTDTQCLTRQRHLICEGLKTAKTGPPNISSIADCRAKAPPQPDNICRYYHCICGKNL